MCKYLALTLKMGATMARFVLSNRRAGKFHESQKEASRQAMGTVLQNLQTKSIIHDNDPADLRARRVVVFEANPAEIAATQVNLPPDALLEPEILHFPELHLPADFAGLFRALPVPLAPGVNPLMLRIRIQGNGQPLANATAILFLRGLGGIESHMKALSNPAGEMVFHY